MTDTLGTALDIFISALLLTGGAFALIGSFGLAKLSDFFKRLHGPTKATTLGVGSMLIASSLWFSLRGPAVSLHEFLITVFLFVTAPVSAQLLVIAALHLEPGARPAEPGPEGQPSPGAPPPRAP